MRIYLAALAFAIIASPVSGISPSLERKLVIANIMSSNTSETPVAPADASRPDAMSVRLGVQPSGDLSRPPEIFGTQASCFNTQPSVCGQLEKKIDIVTGEERKTFRREIGNPTAQWVPTFTAPVLSRPVRAMTVFQGELIVAGDFGTLENSIVSRIARWNGNEWHPLSGPSGVGLDGYVLALTVYNGELIAGGIFTKAGGSPLVTLRVGTAHLGKR